MEGLGLVDVLEEDSVLVHARSGGAAHVAAECAHTLEVARAGLQRDVVQPEQTLHVARRERAYYAAHLPRSARVRSFVRPPPPRPFARVEATRGETSDGDKSMHTRPN